LLSHPDPASTGQGESVDYVQALEFVAGSHISCRLLHRTPSWKSRRGTESLFIFHHLWHADDPQRHGDPLAGYLVWGSLGDAFKPSRNSETFAPSHVIDGITISVNNRNGYWLLPDDTKGWIELTSGSATGGPRQQGF
jgi:hypothetical protein